MKCKIKSRGQRQWKLTGLQKCGREIWNTKYYSDLLSETCAWRVISWACPTAAWCTSPCKGVGVKKLGLFTPGTQPWAGGRTARGRRLCLNPRKQCTQYTLFINEHNRPKIHIQVFPHPQTFSKYFYFQLHVWYN